ncbi:MAG: hypothetical protein PVS3B1_26010 [Ktedonobacteraceae bacterium]
MSTSESERYYNDAESEEDVFLSAQDMFPDDFSEEDASFAQELNALFSSEIEEVPPLFVQTLLAAEDPRLKIAEDGFELKTSAHVFRRLKLQRRLFHPQRPSLRLMRDALPSPSRPLLTLISACMLFFLLTLTLAAPSFAAGMNYLLAGAHTGVLQVHSLPPMPATASSAHTHAAQKNQPTPGPKQISLLEAQNQLHFSMFLPDYIPARYTQSDMYMYMGDQSWADGPVMVLDYYYSLPGVNLRPITIYEFKPRGNVKVLQVVKGGAAKQVQISHNGDHPAIYVEGYWTQTSNSTSLWVYGNRCEIIKEDPRQQVVLWISGDKRDGMDEAELSSITQSLHVLDYNRARVNRVLRHNEEDVTSLFSNDVIWLDNSDNSGGPSFRLFGAPDKSQPYMHISNGSFF